MDVIQGPSPKIVFRSLGPQFLLKIGGRRPPRAPSLDPPLPMMRTMGIFEQRACVKGFYSLARNFSEEMETSLNAIV